MPRNTNPGDIKSGPGKTVPGLKDSLVLTGHVGPGEFDTGHLGHVPEGGGPVQDGPTLPPEPGLDYALSLHVEDPVGAHKAVAIESTESPPFIYSHIEGNLRELMGGVLGEPGALGQFWTHNPPNMALPDWGALNCNEFPEHTHYPDIMPDMGLIYPVYFREPTPFIDPPSDMHLGSLPLGRDIPTDWVWRICGQQYGKMQYGFVRTGGYTLRDDSLRRSMRILPLITDGNDYPYGVVVSGVVYPADRGVLALLHWPSEGEVADFLAQDLLDRCVAALLMGQGICEDGCYKTPDPERIGDGEPGGIFDIGHGPTIPYPGSLDESYNPLAYPGRATGQYDLKELHTGISTIDGTALKAPWDVPRVKQAGVATTAWGQVRLGILPEAGIDPAGTPYGIPILGAESGAYDPPPPDIVPMGMGGIFAVLPMRVVGATVLSGIDFNFFRYRLPCLRNYETYDDDRAGLRNTPHGFDVVLTKEQARYFTPGFTHNTDGVPSGTFRDHSGTRLVRAGNYDPYPEDNWAWQIARYRHMFYLKDSDQHGASVGTYFLMHFKTERDFEKFVRDGIMPWDATEGYSLYSGPSMAAFEGVAATPESYQCVVNGLLSLTLPAPLGPAPAYGFKSFNYHLHRASVWVAEEQSVTPLTNDFTWTAPAGTAGHTHISGVVYLVPLAPAGAQSFRISGIDFTAGHAWDDGYRVDDSPLENMPTDPPAVVSSPMPVILGVAPFAYENHDSLADQANLSITDPNLTDLPWCLRGQHIAFPFTHLGSNGGGPFSEINAPQDVDTLTLDLTPGTYIDPTGDHLEPALTEDAVLRAFVRRPQPDMDDSGTRLMGLPWTAAEGHGVRLEPTNAGGAKVLFHSTGFYPSMVPGSEDWFGNFVNPASVPANQGYPQLFGPTKDTQERFLDEMYRYQSDWGGVPDPDISGYLNGPGMRGWAGGPLEVPVRAGYTTNPTFSGASFTRTLGHESGLIHSLQVAGLPDRNPSGTAFAQVPFPSAGLLRYPAIDYSTGYKPDATETGHAQLDYSGYTGTAYYVRAFDAAFSAGAREAVDGSQFLYLRIDGLGLADFAYNAPGPGGLDGDSGIAVHVKVPGQTTWMDLGRFDGSGPSKQDAVLDGAGCQVAGPFTFDALDPVTKMVFCQVKVSIGPMATLQGPVLGSGEVPVLVKVSMNSNEYDLTKEYNGPGNFGAAAVGLSPSAVRGLVGIRVIRPSEAAPVP